MLDGIKTSEIIPVKLPTGSTPHSIVVDVEAKEIADLWDCLYPSNGKEDSLLKIRPPYCDGDTIYVREPWAEMPYGIVYRADDEEPEGWDSDDIWQSSVAMPKEHSRLFLHVDFVYPDRLLDIPIEEAVRYGLKWYSDQPFESKDAVEEAARKELRSMWDASRSHRICKAESNPWVWIVEFHIISREEAMGDGA